MEYQTKLNKKFILLLLLGICITRVRGSYGPRYHPVDIVLVHEHDENDNAGGLILGLLTLMAALPFFGRIGTPMTATDQLAPEDSWGYFNGGIPPKDWTTVKGAHDCGGNKQSPINIQSNDVIKRDAVPFDFSDFENTENIKMMLFNDGRKVNVNFDDESKPLLKGGGLNETYKISSFHFHWGSDNTKGAEHTVDGKQSAMGLHFVFTPEDGEGDTAVLGVLMEVGGSDNPKFNEIVNNLQKVRTSGTMQPLQPFAITDLLPENYCYYRYEGSLTTPPCTEPVIWTVFTDTVKISQAQFYKKLVKTPDIDRGRRECKDRQL